MKLLKTFGKWIKDYVVEIVLVIGAFILGAKTYENIISKFSSSVDTDVDNDRRNELRTGIDSGFGRIDDTAGKLQDNQSESEELSDRSDELDKRSEQLHSESEQLDKRTDSRIAKNRELLDRIRKSNGKTN